ncbi:MULTISPECIES: MaoC family dehydratase [unclassified Pseudomonas]|uniref:MaoC family dehydratase n=1 Tax=unclassified Pseudomonas TaxID=196821 RepID=UPI000C868FB0|nr:MULTISPECIES: MaoC/PaaZ C-terminal domain-containing protein [unclassified Pseudomonas]PMV18880.1 acyl dehydratase [Pseudomonas sp. FW305-3-2-15-C-TSA2]PMV21879.1 acyl dehydratase [Pseudomonas sp. DP16D-L5]PMV42608.1 acyl dehydratase [Pseudomonas sp. FW305-3-2-15-A-LB2]PMV44251.1 acyl dehydratase [Pseudomonas sp. FW305-3-2-15-C-LB1]PMV49354.1 acyl dehydratase [Pseudomonas sp. FW305-3-2-15-C-R2A1]
MQWKTLDSAPSLPPLYWRAALKRKITGRTLPEHGLRCRVSIDPKRVAAYRKVCGFADSPILPATYPHILAFGLQMQLLTDKSFPFPLLGLIHLSNRIRIHRPLGGVSDLSVAVHAQNLKPHAKGATFDLITTVEDSLGLLWEAESRMLCRGVKLEGAAEDIAQSPPDQVSELTRWKAPADIGRRYARVSGDYNPIHLSALTAKLFGFPQAIAHGLWNKAHTVAALGEHLPAANIEIDVEFRKPVRLPGEVTLLASAAGSSGELRLKGTGDIEHMVGKWRPIA